MTEFHNPSVYTFDQQPVGAEYITPDMGAIALSSGGLVPHCNFITRPPFRIESAERAPNAHEVASLIEARGYARVAPKFRQLVGDEGRDNTFRHFAYDTAPSGEATEHDGLVDLRDFLVSAQGALAKSMLENLTFIGEKEYAEGAAGLASYWKQFLDSDPEAQICAIAPISAGGGLKSDKYLQDRILSQFSDEELVKYRGRLIVDVNRIYAPSDKVRIVLLDDWVISGSQMTHGYHNVMTKLAPEYRNSVELNLLVASSKRINSGFEGVSGDFRGVPVKAYFLAHDANGPVGHVDNGAYISGTHSSVDFDFQDPISLLVYTSNHGFPKLARVERAYGWCYEAERIRQSYDRAAA